MGLIYSNIPELEGTDTDVVLSNLRNVEKELSDTLEKRIAHLCELAKAILRDGGDPDVVKSIILSIRSDGEIDSSLIVEDNENEMKRFFSDVSLLERLIIFKSIFEDKSLDYLNIPQQPQRIGKVAGRVAYVKNSYNDTVFNQFSSLLDGARAAYFNSMSDVCESVSSGDSEFCILPLETGKDGKLMAFYDAIISHGLKINAEYDLKSQDGETFTRYALLSLGIASLSQSRRSKNSSRYLEINYTDTDNLPIRHLISAAEYCGFSVSGINTLIYGGTAGGSINVVLSANGADIKTFLNFLSVDCPDHTVLGYYQRF